MPTRIDTHYTLRGLVAAAITGIIFSEYYWLGGVIYFLARLAAD